MSPASLTKAEQSERALELRRKGYTYREIGKEMGITYRAAHKLVTDAYREVASKASETAEQMVRLQEERIEALYKALEQQIEAGKIGAIEVAIRLLERHAKLRGLDAPAKQEVKVQFQDMTDEELLAEAERLKLSANVIDVEVLASTPLPGERPEQAARLQLPAPIPREPARPESGPTGQLPPCTTPESSTGSHSAAVE